MKNEKNERNIDQYILHQNINLSEGYEECIENYMHYYDVRCKKYKHIYYFWSILKLLAITSIPIWEIVFREVADINWGVIIASAITIFSESILEKFKAKKKWISYRSTCDELTAEQRMYKAKCGPYKGKGNSLNKYVRRVELIISKEGDLWERYMKKKDKKDK